jgi:multiple sugar transport system substrate-binding protein
MEGITGMPLEALETQLTRRRALQLAALGGGAALLAATARSVAAAPLAQQFQGVTLRMLTQAGTDYEPALRAYAQEFTANTGARVEFDFSPWETLMPKVQADLASGQPQFDVFLNDIEFQYTIYPSLLPINDLIAQNSYPMDGFFAPVVKYGEGIGGQPGVRYGLPIEVGASLLFYRTDLISTFPTTWDDYTATIAANTGNGKYGLSFAGVPAQLIKLFLARYWSQGDPLFTPDWQPLINSPKGLKALNMLKDHMTKYSPPGILAWDNPDASNAFLNGDVAILEGWASFVLPSLDDPTKSKVAGKWAIAPYPENGTGNFVQHNAVILKTSPNPDAAFQFISSFTSPDAAKRNLSEFKAPAARKSVWSDPDVVASQPYLPQEAAVLDRGRPFTPNVPQWLELFLAVGDNVSAALAGKAESQAALDAIASKWKDLIAQAPLDFAYQE